MKKGKSDAERQEEYRNAQKNVISGITLDEGGNRIQPIVKTDKMSSAAQRGKDKAMMNSKDLKRKAMKAAIKKMRSKKDPRILTEIPASPTR